MNKEDNKTEIKENNLEDVNGGCPAESELQGRIRGKAIVHIGDQVELLGVLRDNEN